MPIKIAAILMLNLLGATFQNDHNWAIEQGIGNCSAMKTYEDGSILFIQYDSLKENVLLSFMNPIIKSVNDGETRILEIELMDHKTHYINKSWGSYNFLVKEIKGYRTFFGKFRSVILDALKNSDSLEFKTGDTHVARFELSGSSDMIIRLRVCAIAEEVIHAKDPLKE
jgi:hypothetical protein